jgi:glycerol-3-phosphate dehydrogenase
MEPMSSLPPRATSLRTAAATQFDVAVVGGGIVGAGVARDAARRGFRTVLIERDDFASGTSSRSSRLVHGGVRYLEHGWLHLVFEASRERRRLLDAAPHLVRPLRFTWPVYRNQRLAQWEIGAGLFMYDVLAMYRNVGKHKRMSVDAIAQREPTLRTTGLRGGATYWDATTDDSRLTLATALDAEAAGAILFNHASVTALLRSGKKVTGVVIRDEPSGMTIDVRAKIVVNATGPWTDELRRMENPDEPQAVRGTKGVHLLVSDARVGNFGALTLLHPRDQRVMFVLPGGRHTIIGTTDTRTTATPDQVRASAEDIAYLLEAANHFFPAARLTLDDVISAWAGIRPLVASAAAGVAPTDQSREHEIDVGPRGVISVSGGKLTTYRSMAEQIVDVVADRLKKARAKSDTARASLPGGDIADLDEEIASASDDIGDTAIATHLVHAHGAGWRRVWALGERRPQLRARIVNGCDAIRAELVHAVRHEHARTLADLLVRRTHVAFETRDHGVAAARDAAALVAPDLAWDADDISRMTAAYQAEVQRLFTIDG